MSKREKREEKIRNSQQSVSFDDLRWLLEKYGFRIRQGNPSSHFVFRRESRFGNLTICVPWKRPFVGRVYVSKVLYIIDRISLDDEGVEEV